MMHHTLTMTCCTCVHVGLWGQACDLHRRIHLPCSMARLSMCAGNARRLLRQGPDRSPVRLLVICMPPCTDCLSAARRECQEMLLSLGVPAASHQACLAALLVLQTDSDVALTVLGAFAAAHHPALMV